MPRNRTQPHLELRRSGFYWRRRLPRPAGAEKSSKKIFRCFSLGSTSSPDARILARRLTALSDRIFAAMTEKTMPIAPEIADRLLTELVRFEIDAFERVRAMAPRRCPEAAAHEQQREAALQETLRRAIELRDREVARQPLRCVAELLGIALDESDPDWQWLAIEATRVLIDVSAERARRDRGFYGGPSRFFRAALRAEGAALDPMPVHRVTPEVAPAGFALAATAQAAAPVLSASEEPRSAVVAAAAEPAGAQAAAPAPSAPEVSGTEPGPVARPASAEPARPRSDAAPAPQHAPPAGQVVEPASAPSEMNAEADEADAGADVILPAGLERPEGLDPVAWQKLRISCRPPRIFVDRRRLSEESRAALEKQRGITVVEAITLYFELRGLGYLKGFGEGQKCYSERGRKWARENTSNQRLALNFWSEALGDGPVDETEIDAVSDALELLWRIPSNHGKSAADRDDVSYLELIERADAREANGAAAARTAEREGATAEQIDRIRLESHVKRLSVNTYVKHGRVLRAVGEMLWDMQLVDRNPFAICNWTNAELAELKKTEENRGRVAWDDRIHALFGSPVFREELEDVGDPLFWAPLIARLQGFRMEECLQLGPEDFGSDRGIPYMRVRNTIINGVKTLTSERTVPVHPQLVELGLLKLVELRRRQGHIRLFPFLTRGKCKGTFSANFSKSFAYYRRKHDIYWAGLDFHALRTTFHNDLLSDDKSDAIRCRLMGHARTDEGDRSYGQSLGIEALASRLHSVKVDLSMVRSPFRDEPGQPATSRAAAQGLRLVG